MNIGTFKVVSGKIMVSDPCYEKDTWCNGVLNNVKNGNWIAEIELNEEKRVSRLIAICGNGKNIRGGGRKENFTVGVDSGQAGIYDLKFFKDDNVVKNVERLNPDNTICKDEPWYSINCDRTIGKEKAGVIPYGCVSSSGYGDGSYDCYTWTDKSGKIVVIEIKFLLE